MKIDTHNPPLTNKKRAEVDSLVTVVTKAEDHQE